MAYKSILTPFLGDDVAETLASFMNMKFGELLGNTDYNNQQISNLSERLNAQTILYSELDTLFETGNYKFLGTGEDGFSTSGLYVLEVNGGEADEYGVSAMQKTICVYDNELINVGVVRNRPYYAVNTLWQPWKTNATKESLDILSSRVTSGILANKAWVSYGDSITAFNQWQPTVASFFGLNHVNCGISGTMMSGLSEQAMWRDARLVTIVNANPDVITILAGINDCYSHLALGTEANLLDPFANKNIETFYGAYSYVLEFLFNWKPSLKIVLLTTMWALDEVPDTTTGLIPRDFSKAVENIAYFYGLRCVDLRGEMGLNKYTKSIYLDEEYVHPTTKGAEIMSELVIDKFKTIRYI